MGCLVRLAEENMVEIMKQFHKGRHDSTTGDPSLHPILLHVMRDKWTYLKGAS